MARLRDDLINIEKTNKSGKDEKGEYYIERIYGQEYCHCHPETCCHFDGLRHVDYERKVYK